MGDKLSDEGDGDHGGGLHVGDVRASREGEEGDERGGRCGDAVA